MLLATILSIAIGIALGVISGLIPGIHTNLIASLVAIFIDKLQSIPGIFIVLVLASMLTVSIFLNFIPTLILGVPDPEKTALIRPLHRAIIQGHAYSIIKQITIILLLTSLSCILLSPILFLIISNTKTFSSYVPIILMVILLLSLKNEKNKFLGIAIILLAGFLGILTFSLTSLNEPLLPLLSGLFGISSIILSLRQSPKFKNQFFPTHTKINKKELKAIPLYSLIVSFLSFIPAVSSSQYTTILKKDEKTYALTCASFTISTALISFITVYTLNKARNGVALASVNILAQINPINIILIILTIIIASSAASILLIKTSKIMLKNIGKIPYKKISISVIILITILVLILSGPIGLVIAFLATLLGFITASLDLNRNYLMASLIIPTIFYFI